MRTDNYGQLIFTEDDLCNLYLQDPDRKMKKVLVEIPIEFNSMLIINDTPTLEQYQDLSLSLEDFDKMKQNTWHIPVEYVSLDIAKWILDQCKSEAELQRAGDELIKFQERNMFMLLRYMKYLVDTMRKNGIVWGVGRGSSVSSYVLYLIGIHRINSLTYDLSIDEFLK